MTYHNLRIIALNSNQMQEEQVAWLEGVLAENTSPWVVCTFHHPIYSTGKDRDNSELRTLWKPLFDKYKVDLVLQGHDHTYGRTGFEVPADLADAEMKDVVAESSSSKPVLQTVSESIAVGESTATATATAVPETIANVPTGVQKVDEQFGTVYVVSVSGPKMYDNNRKSFMKRVAEDTQLYQIIHIDGNALRFEARTAIGELYDAFELRKQPGKINQLVELEPEVDQRLRPRE